MSCLSICVVISVKFYVIGGGNGGSLGTDQSLPAQLRPIHLVY